MSFKISILVIVSLCSGCYWAHKDDVVPTPYLNSIFTPNFTIANHIMRDIKKVKITVNILQSQDCFYSYSLGRTAFVLLGEAEILKSIDPVRPKMSFILRLKDGKSYETELKLSDDTSLKQSFTASQKDVNLWYTVPCR